MVISDANTASETVSFMSKHNALSNTGEKTRTPWEFQNPFSPLAGHIGAELYLEGLGMTIYGTEPRDI